MKLRSGKKTLRPGFFSNHCGLGVSDHLPNRHAIDAVCRKHDHLYDLYVKQGKDPYWYYNHADKIFLNDLRATQPKSTKELIVKWGSILFAKAKQSFPNLPSEGEDKFITPEKKRKLNDKFSPMGKNNPRARQTLFGVDVDGRSKRVAAETAKKKSLRSDEVNDRRDNPRRAIEPDFDPAPDDDVDMEDPGPPSALSVSSGGKKHVTHETELDPYDIKWVKIVPWNKVDTIRSTYVYDPADTFLLPTGYTTKRYPISFRTNSLWNIALGTVGSPIIVDGANTITGGATGSATGNDTTVVPTFRPWYTKLYKYYHVLRFDYKIKFKVRDAASNHQFVRFNAFVSIDNDHIPPDDMNFNEYRLNDCFKHMISIGCDTTNGADRAYGEITGFVCPGAADREIRLDEEATTWTAVGAAPTLPETLTIWTARQNLGNIDVAVNLDISVELSWVVQFKEFQETFKYVTSTMPGLTSLTFTT